MLEMDVSELGQTKLAACIMFVQKERWNTPIFCELQPAERSALSGLLSHIIHIMHGRMHRLFR